MFPGTFSQQGSPLAHDRLKSPGDHDRVPSGSNPSAVWTRVRDLYPVHLSNTGSAVLDTWNLQKVRAA